ncbi:hypothetical protein RRG08_033347 [Elysia crispata]|uniref:Uncharacterized protein n=1 Tax=Elysia crispata TaxID=231223 RepID=A0AAE1DBW9_9GAST|nr:hypothetical protein RRG08_033347 [Elysia crispata]
MCVILWRADQNFYHIELGKAAHFNPNVCVILWPADQNFYHIELCKASHFSPDEALGDQCPFLVPFGSARSDHKPFENLPLFDIGQMLKQ